MDAIVNQLSNLFQLILPWLGWAIAVPTTIIQIFQLRHVVTASDYRGSFIHCSTYQGLYREEVTIVPNYIIQGFLPITLRVFGIGSIQMPHLNEKLLEITYYDKDGDEHEVPLKQWEFQREGIGIKGPFLSKIASEGTRKLAIRAARGFTLAEIQQKIDCRKTSEVVNGQTYTIVFAVTNTNRIFQLQEYRLVLDDIPADCSRFQFVTGQGRVQKVDFIVVDGNHPIVKIPEINPGETINITCRYNL